jgi:hypothetical protein
MAQDWRFLMKNKVVLWAATTIAALTFVFAIAGRAQSGVPEHLSGLINDYTAATISGQKVGPWEVHGEWSLKLRRSSGHADFLAALTMERSDEGVNVQGGNFDDPAVRAAHTHHIMLERGLVTPLENGFRVTGAATIAGNGDQKFLSEVTIDITGGTLIQFSNIQLTFGSPASNHFGTSPLNGVVERGE